MLAGTMANLMSAKLVEHVEVALCSAVPPSSALPRFFGAVKAPRQRFEAQRRALRDTGAKAKCPVIIPVASEGISPCFLWFRVHKV
jgi:hypothetical protein